MEEYTIQLESLNSLFNNGSITKEEFKKEEEIIMNNITEYYSC